MPGPVFFVQNRVGQDGKIFAMVKFRTMSLGHGGSSITVKGENRITPLGAYLRKYKLDELPELWNILKGDMSLVGPRPQTPRHIAALARDEAAELLSVRPGVTGVSALAFIGDDAALAGNRDAEDVYLKRILPAKVALELDYVRRWTLRTDVRLLGRTVAQLWSPRARRRSREMVSALLDEP